MYDNVMTLNRQNASHYYRKKTHSVNGPSIGHHTSNNLRYYASFDHSGPIAKYLVSMA